MLKIHYTQEPGGQVLYFDTYANVFDRKRVYQFLLNKGYEIVGES